MLREINRFIFTRIALVGLSAVLLSLSFPVFNLSFLAWLAFVPLFFALKDTAKKEAFVFSYLYGFLFFGVTIFWLHHVSILGYIILVSILSIFFGMFGLFFLYAKRYPLYAIFFLPACWVILEHARSNLFTGFGWALLGYSQYLNIPIIQISSLTGAYGVSFLIMMVNAITYHILSDGVKKSVRACLIGIVVVSSVLVYGYLKLNEADAKETLNVSLIQGNIPQALKWDPKYKERIFDTYSRLTKDAKRDKPDLIIWPETALPGFAEEEELLNKVSDLARRADAYMLIGAPSYGNSENESIFNSAILLSKRGKIIKQYDKLHLVPFGEYIPFGKYAAFLRKIIDKPIGNFAKGNEYTIFELDNNLRFGVLICFEDIFSGLVRNFVLKDVDFMVNITNDAWFKKTSAPSQHAQSSVFRAVENRIPVVRAANTGLSCFIDRYGRIIDSVKFRGEEIFVEGYKTGNVAISSDKSFYTKFGDIFLFLCLAIVAIGGLQRWLGRHSQY